MRTNPTKTAAIIATIGIDIGKNVPPHRPRQARRDRAAHEGVSWPSRGRLANMPRCLVGMEACAGAHHIGRQLEALGHDVRLIPRSTSAVLKGHKNDYRDAEAIAEAVQRPTMKFVPSSAGANGPASAARVR